MNKIIECIIYLVCFISGLIVGWRIEAHYDFGVIILISIFSLLGYIAGILDKREKEKD